MTRTMITTDASSLTNNISRLPTPFRWNLKMRGNTALWWAFSFNVKVYVEMLFFSKEKYKENFEHLIYSSIQNIYTYFGGLAPSCINLIPVLVVISMYF